MGPGQAFASIAAAVAAAQPGSTVLIAPGRYEEQLVISSSITLAATQPVRQLHPQAGLRVATSARISLHTHTRTHAHALRVCNRTRQLTTMHALSVATVLPQEGRVVIACDTQQPYVHCLEVPSSSSSSGGRLDVRVRGIWFEHFSKSVANNYCIFAQVRHGWLCTLWLPHQLSLRGECQPGEWDLAN